MIRDYIEVYVAWSETRRNIHFVLGYKDEAGTVSLYRSNTCIPFDPLNPNHQEILAIAKMVGPDEKEGDHADLFISDDFPVPVSSVMALFEGEGRVFNLLQSQIKGGMFYPTVG